MLPSSPLVCVKKSWKNLTANADREESTKDSRVDFGLRLFFVGNDPAPSRWRKAKVLLTLQHLSRQLEDIYCRWRAFYVDNLAGLRVFDLNLIAACSNFF